MLLRRTLALMTCAAADVLSPRAASAEGLLSKLSKRDWKQLAKPLLPSVVALPIQGAECTRAAAQRRGTARGAR